MRGWRRGGWGGRLGPVSVSRHSRRPRSPFHHETRLDTRHWRTSASPAGVVGVSTTTVAPGRGPTSSRRKGPPRRGRRRSWASGTPSPGGARSSEGVADVDLAARPDPDRRPVETEVALPPGRPGAPRTVQARKTRTGGCGGLEQRRPYGSSAFTTGPARVLRCERAGLWPRSRTPCSVGSRGGSWLQVRDTARSWQLGRRAGAGASAWELTSSATADRFESLGAPAHAEARVPPELCGVPRACRSQTAGQPWSSNYRAKK